MTYDYEKIQTYLSELGCSSGLLATIAGQCETMNAVVLEGETETQEYANALGWMEMIQGELSTAKTALADASARC